MKSSQVYYEQCHLQNFAIGYMVTSSFILASPFVHFSSYAFCPYYLVQSGTLPLLTLFLFLFFHSCFILYTG